MSDIDDLFENLGFGKMQYIISFCCFTLQLWITNEQLGFGVVVAGATCELHIDDERLAWLMAGNFAAQMISCYVWGELSDAYGRRKIILSAATTANCLSILSACMPEYWSFLAVRTMAGLFISGAVVCVMTYLGEFTKITLRPTVLNFMSYAIGISLIYVPSLAGGLLPLEIEPRPWRILLLSNQLPGIIGLTMLIFLPESPKYYLSVSEQEKALKVMERVCRMNKGKDVTLVSMGVSSLSQLRMRNKADNQRRWHDIKVLFARHGKIMLSFLFVVFSLSGLAFSLPFWMLRIRVLTAHEKEPQTMCDLLDGKSKEGGNRMVHKHQAVPFLAHRSRAHPSQVSPFLLDIAF
ncbi:putative transporter SVOPL isoform X2 [Drosophila eugracilis]|uniref:putative transporter SVOPL isoform X2 n=1 Tax=Drosophila eugracilis TaxID=29029 RepID=UPI0007E81A67|nr:putative transporter SVOPL isoform X2 [Drosophila eugracilis]